MLFDNTSINILLIIKKNIEILWSFRFILKTYHNDLDSVGLENGIKFLFIIFIDSPPFERGSISRVY